MSDSPSRNRVLIAGGGIAALEGLLALRALTDGEAEVTLLSPEPEFTYRPLLVLEPFEPDLAPRRDLAAVMDEQNGRFVEDRLHRIDLERRVAETGEGQEIGFDHALIAVGARARPAFRSAHTLWVERTPTTIETILGRAAAAGGLDLIVPPGVTWSLPIYEFALMAERRAREEGPAFPIRVVTPEQSPLVVFGPAASSAVGDVLEARGIQVLAGTRVSEGDDGSLQGVGAGGNYTASGCVVSLPVLDGIPIDGLPADDGGFLPIDDTSRIRGCEGIYAAGDGADFPIKQGGIGTQQADAAAAAIAAAMGFDVAGEPTRPVLRGKLLTGSESVNIRTSVAGGDGEGVVSSDYLWWPPHKVSGLYLAPWLAADSVHIDSEPPTTSIDVEVGAATGGA